jgi:hypothetical protein
MNHNQPPIQIRYVCCAAATITMSCFTTDPVEEAATVPPTLLHGLASEMLRPGDEALAAARIPLRLPPQSRPPARPTASAASPMISYAGVFWSSCRGPLNARWRVETPNVQISGAEPNPPLFPLLSLSAAICWFAPTVYSYYAHVPPGGPNNEA